MKIFKWISNNILFIFTLLLLVFIPLYPKFPLLDVKNTWVYIRAEDFFVGFVLAVWVMLILGKKITLKTPLTLPIILFWIVGAIATLHGIMLVFSTISDAHANVAFLSMLRRIEYLSVFFIAYAGMKDKRFVPYVIAILVFTLLVVIGYGFGQKFFGFPAYLTMNEEFAKGIAIRLSPLSRVPSTFAGHYDLAAYLVLVIPLLISLTFGFRSFLVRLILLSSVALGFALLFMTVSRVSFFVLLLSLVVLLFFQKKRLATLSLFVAAFVFLSFSPSLLQRFGSTVKEIDVLVDSTTGEPIGHVTEVPSKSFEGKIIRKKYAQKKSEVVAAIDDNREYGSLATASAIVVFSQLPPLVPLVVESNAPTGEDLPQGSGYINLPLSPVKKRIGQFFYQKAGSGGAIESAKIANIHGEFLVKRTLAYDLSFTTRFQGEWPRAKAAFKKNILFGSGYGSTSLAVDNNYLRILGEVGILGFSSFFAIFLIAGIYIKKVLPNVDSPVIKNFVLGFSAGLFGLALNAIFIDVFEASKIAFLIWLLLGVTLGILHLYQKQDIDFYREFRKVVTSTYAIVIYLFIFAVVVFLPLSSYYFVGDDFTWFRWIADCGNGCPSIFKRVFEYFTDSGGFFYRPGTKIYFLFMYLGFWLNQSAYHTVSIGLHFIVAVLLFLLAKKIFKNVLLSTLSAFLFLALSGSSEAVFWISSTGFLFNAMFSLLSLLFYIAWREKNKRIYFVLSLCSIIFGFLFHELGVVTPFLIMLYVIVIRGEFPLQGLYKKFHSLLFLPLLPYLILRLLSNSHWFSGDYSYNLLKLPYNIVGNIIGYFSLSLFGPASLSFYQNLRNFSREHIALGTLIFIALVSILALVYKRVIAKMDKEERKIVIFGFLFFVIALLPFLGLGNITSRYSYLASIGFVILFVFFLKKLYGYLQSNGWAIALSSVIVVICMFFLVHLIAIQAIHNDWYQAGEKSKNFLTSLDYAYAHYSAEDTRKLYFVNVPIRNGEAWVFPVGLSDAIWLAFRDKGVLDYKVKSADQAFNAIGTHGKVFQFDDKGSLIEMIKTQSGEIVPLTER